MENNIIYRGQALGMAVGIISVLLLLNVLPIFAVASIPQASEYTHKPRIPERHGNSLNWAGYAVTGSNVTDVKGSWVVPAVTCSKGSQYSSFWVGIDGYSDNTVEQTGTDSDCSSGSPSYYAWYEFYPAGSVTISSSQLSVAPGNIISAEVSYDITTGIFTTTITNLNTSQTYTATCTNCNAQRSSAEWITEAPSIANRILPLANFGQANYGLDNTGVSNTNYATINGVTGNINSFGSSSVNPITMVTKSGIVRAKPSSLSTDGTSFYVTWYHS